MEDMLNYVDEQLGFLNGIENRIGLIEDLDNKIDAYLDGRDEQDLETDERQNLTRMRNELDKRRLRRDELTVLRDSYEELTDEPSRTEMLGKVDTINTVYSQRKQRKLGENIVASTTEPDVHYIEVREANVDLSLTGEKTKNTSVTIGTREPVGRIKGDSLEAIKQMIVLSAVLKNSKDLTTEQEKTIRDLLGKMRSLISKDYDFTNEYETLMKEIEVKRDEPINGEEQLSDEQSEIVDNDSYVDGELENGDAENNGQNAETINRNEEENIAVETNRKDEMHVPGFMSSYYEKNLEKEMKRASEAKTKKSEAEKNGDNTETVNRNEEENNVIKPNVKEEEMHVPDFLSSYYKENLEREKNAQKEKKTSNQNIEDEHGNPLIVKPANLKNKDPKENEEKDVAESSVSDNLENPTDLQNNTYEEELPEIKIDENDINKSRSMLLVLTALVFKLLKNMTKFIKPVSNFFEKIENGLLGNEARIMIDSAKKDVRDQDNGLDNKVDGEKEASENIGIENDEEKEALENTEMENDEENSIQTQDEEWLSRGMDYVESRFNNKDSFMRREYMKHYKDAEDYENENGITIVNKEEYYKKFLEENNIPIMEKNGDKFHDRFIYSRSYLAYKTVMSFMEQTDEKEIETSSDGKNREFEDLYKDMLLKEAERIGVSTKDSDGKTIDFDEISSRVNEKAFYMKTSNDIATKWREGQHDNGDKKAEVDLSK